MSEGGFDEAVEARRLLRGARAASLATVTGDGDPFVSLVTPATAPDGSVLLLLSDLSDHTRHLRAEPRCALLVTGPAMDANPQTAPRLTLNGTAVQEDDPGLHARWVSVHPYAAFYAGFGDFHLWRITPGSGAFIGGFARAFRLTATALQADPAACAAVMQAEAGVVQHCNADHADALDAIAAAQNLSGTGWRMVGCDVDGFDLASEQGSARVHWPAPVDGPGAIRAAMVHLAGAAKTQQ